MTHMMPCPLLPPGIIDIVVDYLFEDKKSLGACALVCHQWLPSARYHLFSYIQIHNLTPDGETCQRWFKDFAQFLKMSTINPYIQNLHILSLPDREGCHLRSICDINDVLGLVDLLPNLSSLDMQEFRLELSSKSTAAFAVALESNSKPLRTLRITGMELDDGALQSLFLSCSGL